MAKIDSPLAATPRRRRLTNRLFQFLIYGAFGLALIPLVSVSWTVLSNGIERLSPYFLSVTMRGVYGGMDAGGIYHAIIGTLLITAVATVISVPIGLLVAIYLVEYGQGSKLARADRKSVVKGQSVHRRERPGKAERGRSRV